MNSNLRGTITSPAFNSHRQAGGFRAARRRAGRGDSGSKVSPSNEDTFQLGTLVKGAIPGQQTLLPWTLGTYLRDHTARMAPSYIDRVVQPPVMPPTGRICLCMETQLLIGLLESNQLNQS